jgi:hypothetical protein
MIMYFHISCPYKCSKSGSGQKDNSIKMLDNHSHHSMGFRYAKKREVDSLSCSQIIPFLPTLIHPRDQLYKDGSSRFTSVSFIKDIVH